MLKALARKEMREVLPLVLLGVAIELLLASSAVGIRTGVYDNYFSGQIPFISDESTVTFFYVAGAVGFALGLWQTMLESTRDTFQFLLHRPMARDAIFGTKMLIGVAATLLVAIVPVACYSLWAATPGTHASPFRWEMTTWAWLLCAQMPLVYLGAFLSGLRPGRWFGSRFLPLAGGISALYLLQFLQRLASWPWLALVVTLAIEALLIWVVLGVGRTRDFS
jgi:hypothetical protein